jgi:hypothetical protein
MKSVHNIFGGIQQIRHLLKNRPNFACSMPTGSGLVLGRTRPEESRLVLPDFTAGISVRGSIIIECYHDIRRFASVVVKEFDRD